MASIRGHQTAIKLLKNGQAVALQAVKNFEANQKSTMMQAEYLGQALPEGDQAFMGYEGSMEMEVKDAAADDLIDAVTTNNLNGVGADELSIVDTEYYPDGTSRSWAYFGVLVSLNKRAAGLSEKVTKRLTWQADGRVAL